MRPRVTPAAVVLTASLGVLVAVPVVWLADRPEPTLVGSLPAPPAVAASADPPTAGSVPVSRANGGAAPEQSLPPRPVGLSIAALGVVDARVVPVGVDPDGQVELPDSGAVLGWYRFGSRPGSPAGSAVVVGHRDTVAEGPGALFDLPELQPGDRLEVRLADGSSLAYRVVARESLVKQRLPLDRLFARDGQHRLTVITCGGAYLPDVGGYQENVVVTAVPAREGGR